MSKFLTTLNRDLETEINSVLEHLNKCLGNWKVKEFKTLTDTLGNLYKMKVNTSESFDMAFYKSTQEKIEALITTLQKKYKEDLEGQVYDNYRHWLISLERLVSLHIDIENAVKWEVEKKLKATNVLQRWDECR